MRDGRRHEFAAFGWDPREVPDPQAPDTFARSKLDWREPEQEPHAGLLDWHRRLIRLRRALPALSDGRMDRVRTAFDEDARWLALERGPVTAVCNLADRTQRVGLARARPPHVLLASDPQIRVMPGGVALPPDSVAIPGPPQDPVTGWPSQQEML